MSEKHKKNCVYGNILDEEIDYVGRFETLAQDAAYLKSKLGLKQPFNFHLVKSESRKKYTIYYNDNTRRIVEELYLDDIKKYGYDF